MISKIICVKEPSFFENELNKLYEKYSGCDIDVQFSTSTNNNEIMFIALVTIRGETK